MMMFEQATQKGLLIMATLKELRDAAIATAARLSRLIAEGADASEIDAIQSDFLALRVDIADKAQRVLMVADALDANAAMYREDAAQASAMARSLESQARKLKQSLGDTMLEAEALKISTPIGTIKHQVSETWDIKPLIPVDQLPDELVKKTINVAAVKKAVENGFDVTGFVSYAVESTSTVRLWKKRGNESVDGD